MLTRKASYDVVKETVVKIYQVLVNCELNFLTSYFIIIQVCVKLVVQELMRLFTFRSAVGHKMENQASRKKSGIR